MRLSAWNIGWQISLSGSLSASLYCTYTVLVTAILGDMGDFFTNFIFQIVCIINDISPYGGYYITSSKT